MVEKMNYLGKCSDERLTFWWVWWHCGKKGRFFVNKHKFD
jgi:hypothetical protein